MLVLNSSELGVGQKGVAASERMRIAPSSPGVGWGQAGEPGRGKEGGGRAVGAVGALIRGNVRTRM